METDGSSEVMTIIQVFTQLFLQARQNEYKQVSQDLFLSGFFFLVRKCNILQEKPPIQLLRGVTEYNDVNNSCIDMPKYSPSVAA